MNLEDLLEIIKSGNKSIEFNDLMNVVDENYYFTPTQFSNAKLVNKAGENNGSCKLFSFAKLHKLTEPQVLACFGAYYRDDVLRHPNEDNHQNIRNFMKTGWAGIHFEGNALSEK